MKARIHRPRIAGLPIILAIVVAMLAPFGTTLAAAPSGGGRTAALVDKIAQSTDPYATFAGLSEADQAAVQEYLTVTSIADTSTQLPDPQSGAATALSGGCWTWTWQRNGYNSLGQTLWSYFQRIDWCGNGSTITSTPQRVRWGEVYFPFWSWKHLGNQTWGGVGQANYRAWTQGEFKLCVTPNVGCAQFRYPWLDMTAWADGRGTGSVGG